MRLSDLVRGVADARLVGSPDIDVGEVRDDSRQVNPGDLFVAVAGTVANGHAFVADAAARGAAAIVIDAGVALPPDFGGTLVVVNNTRRALGRIAANRFGVAGELRLAAVTGTNGKTTTTYLYESMLAAAGVPTGVIGTISYRLGQGGGTGPARFLRPAPLTTPGALATHEIFAQMKAAGASDVVLEASSHALDQGRLHGCAFRVAGFTNLTQDHLDYHGDLAQYFDAKAILFEQLLEPRHGVAVLPLDRDEGRAMRRRVRGTVLGVALSPGEHQADVVVRSAQLGSFGIRARLATPAGELEIASPLVGDYNLANITLAAGMAIARGIRGDAIVAGLSRLTGVPGRLERVEAPPGILCVVDYAHTPDALERALAALRPLVGSESGSETGGPRARRGRLIAVFGCGGDRDRGKRPIMGQLAARDADLAIVTSDNPRTEDPRSIVDMVVEGVRRESIPELDASELAEAMRGFHVEVDRGTAIQQAVRATRPGDVLIIAGKGHEDYQIIGATRRHFDDRLEAAAAFRTHALSAPGDVAVNKGQ